jgi:hypothetical protein
MREKEPAMSTRLFIALNAIGAIAAAVAILSIAALIVTQF